MSKRFLIAFNILIERDLPAEEYKKDQGSFMTEQEEKIRREIEGHCHRADVTGVRLQALSEIEKDKDTTASDPGFKPDGSPSKWGCP